MLRCSAKLVNSSDMHCHSEVSTIQAVGNTVEELERNKQLMIDYVFAEGKMAVFAAPDDVRSLTWSNRITEE